VHVAMVGSSTQVPDIAALLPRRWGSVRYRQLSEVYGADVIVLGDATPTRVRAARLLHPAATIVAVIPASAPAALLVAVLQAGADTCLRSGTSVWLARQVLGAYGLRQRDGRTGLRTPTRPAA
jgi:hypothetical protein